MSVHTFSLLTDGQHIAFASATDTLRFDQAAITAGAVRLTQSGTSLSVSASGKTVWLDATRLGQLSATNTSFADGSVLALGDRTDHLWRDWYGQSYANLTGATLSQQVWGLGGADLVQAGAGNDWIVGNIPVDPLEHVSRNGATGGNQISVASSISADGRYVAFDSDSTNLAGPSAEILVKDLATGTLTSASGTMGAQSPTLSADGNWVVFKGIWGLVPSAPTGMVYLSSTAANPTGPVVEVISTTADGTYADRSTDNPDISADGRYVVFTSWATNLAAGGNTWNDVFLKDRQTGALTRISTSQTGTDGNNDSDFAKISADGRYVVFQSFASNLVAGDTNGYPDIFVWDRNTGQLSSPTIGTAIRLENNVCYSPDIAYDGGVGGILVFETPRAFVEADTNNASDIYAYSLSKGTFQLVSSTAAGTAVNGASEDPAISGDGRFVVFRGYSDLLVPGDTNGYSDIFVKDLQDGRIARVSVPDAGGQGNLQSRNPSISLGGDWITFETSATNLSATDANGNLDDVYRVSNPLLRDTLAGGAGDDTYVIERLADIVVEQPSAGIDLIRTPLTYTLGDNLENLTLTGAAPVTGTGNALNNVILGNDANNLLTGLAGNDTLDGGAGVDTMLGGAGDDTYVVDNGADVVTELAGEGTDLVRSAVTRTLGDHQEHLTLTGTADIDGTGNALANRIEGNAGNNVLTGLAGADTLIGGTGVDTMAGGADDDLYIVDATADVLIEAAGAGTDTVQSPVSFTLADHFENLVLTGGANVDGTGNALANRIDGNSGNNVLDGGGGADTLAGGAGNDTYIVDAADRIEEAAGAGTDTVQSPVGFTLPDNVENLVLTGSAHVDGTGNALANRIDGNAGNNVLDGAGGADTLAGGAGDDTYYVDDGDVIVEAAGGGTDTVRAATTWTLGDALENLTLTGFVAFDAIGNALANRIEGNAAGNKLTGHAGADTLTGGAGADTFRFVAASDSTFAATDRITDFSAGDRIDLVGIAGVTLHAGNYAWAGSAGATVAAIQADAGVANQALFFTDGADGFLYVKGAGTGTSFDGTLVLLAARITAPTVSGFNSPPEGTVTIAGTAAQGQTLTASDTLSDADGIGPITYQWKADGVDLSTGATLALTQALVGKTITVRAWYTDGTGAVEGVTSAATAPVLNVNDAPTGAVTIAGTAKQDQTLTAGNTLADADGLGAITYQWLANGAQVATGPTLVLTQALVGKAITVQAAYTDGFGKAEVVTSVATAPVAGLNAAPTGTVSIGGIAAQGQTLTASNTLADADGLGAISYRWLANGLEIAGATGNTLLLTQAQVGKTITVRAAYTDGAGAAESMLSGATAPVANVNDPLTGSVSIGGAPIQGATLVASDTLDDADGIDTVAYQWLANGVAIPGANGASLPLTQAQVGRTITVRASYTDGGGMLESTVSAATAAVVNVNDPPTGTLTIGGSVAQGQTLTVNNALADADGLGAFAWQWFANDVAIAGATKTTLALRQALVGKTITVQAAYTDGFGKAEVVTSAPSLPVANVNDPPTGIVAIGGTPAQGRTVSANDNLGDIDGLGDFAWQWLSDGLPIAGATGRTLLLGAAQVGHALSVRVSWTDGGGTLERVTSGSTTVGDGSGIAAGIARIGTDIGESLTGGSGPDTINGLAGNDTLTGLAGDDVIDGGTGLDTAYYAVPRAQAAILLRDNFPPHSATVTITGLGSDTLANVERLRFPDFAVAFDVTPTGNVDDAITKGLGGNGGKAYRLYQAALARTPDLAGLGYWIAQIDDGVKLFDIASGFLGSPEFATKYGANPTNQEYTRALYMNVLGREPDANGYAYWNALLDGKPWNGNDYGSTTRQQMLVDFSESTENKANAIEVIGNGFDYLPWG